ncbi:SDR family oxidoreductase [Streptomyces sp. NPDC046939]|uniref:SDR family oxidoreductase n=1 Tax=Streptomyces sp. NPDC046939 TaxID=3155376 RepID=UPI0033EDCD81
MSDSPLTGRTVVVTGAARGIGAEVARALAGRGARVALLGHEKGPLDRVADTLATPSLTLETDITDAAALQAAARTVRARLGRPSAVVANAGVAEAGPLSTANPASWRRVVEVNLTGSAFTARTFLPDLLHTRGYYLQVASLASIGAVPMMSAYCASKAGAEAFAHALRAETAHRGVAVGIAYLNWVDTDMIHEADDHPALSDMRSMLPPFARRLMAPGPVAGRIARAVEQRKAALYAPGWVRLAQLGRGFLPPVISRRARLHYGRLAADRPLEQTGPLGEGGLADHALAGR